jgi:cyclase
LTVLESRIEFREIASGVWAVVTSLAESGGGPNSGFIVAGEEVIVIDSLVTPNLARELLRRIEAFTGKQPTFLVNTHSHGDHVIGNEVFAPPATVIAHEDIREILLREGRSIIDTIARLRRDLSEELKETRIVAPSITYRGRMALCFGARRVELINWGDAHSRGDTVVYLPQERVLYSGDLLFNHIFPPIYGSSAGWVRALEQIEGMDIKVIVPGHGFLGGKREITDLKNCLIELRRQIRMCYERSLSKEEAISEIDMGTYRQWPHQERLALAIDQLYKEFREAS